MSVDGQTVAWIVGAAVSVVGVVLAGLTAHRRGLEAIGALGERIAAVENRMRGIERDVEQAGAHDYGERLARLEQRVGDLADRIPRDIDAAVGRIAVKLDALQAAVERIASRN